MLQPMGSQRVGHHLVTEQQRKVQRTLDHSPTRHNERRAKKDSEPSIRLTALTIDVTDVGACISLRKRHQKPETGHRVPGT